VFGKTGPVLHTDCPRCGISSKPIVDRYVEQNKPIDVEISYTKLKEPYIEEHGPTTKPR
jgi:hypothetical protein